MRKLERSKVIVILNLVIPDRAYVQDFINYLNEKEVAQISLDVWKMFFEFSNQFVGSLEKFDEDGAWPTQIDEFVKYLREKGKDK